MDYLFCIPAVDRATKENCEKIHNILARVSDQYKIKITPEPAKVKQAPAPEYYRKYRIFKEVREKEGNNDAYLEKEEEEMILSVCKTPEEQELMRSCIYGYRYPASMVLKSFRDELKSKTKPRPERPARQERPERSARPERSEKLEQPERPERPARQERPERPARQDRPERPARQERPERPARQDRPERSARQDRPERQTKQDRSERPARQERQGRSERSAKQEWQDRPERQGKPERKR